MARTAAEAADKAAAQHGPGKVLVQEPDVLDTWFSSGLWPFSTLGWPNTQAQDFKTFYPTQVRQAGLLIVVLNCQSHAVGASRRTVRDVLPQS